MALAQALQGAEILVLPAAWVAGRSKSIIGQRCLPLVRWIPLLYGGGGGVREQKYRSKPDLDPFGVTIAAASEMPALIMAK